MSLQQSFEAALDEAADTKGAKRKGRKPRFTVSAGRVIERNGVPFIHIGKEGNTRPVEADEITHVICKLLNKARVK